MIPKVNRGLWETTCPGEFLSCNEYATFADVARGGCMCGGRGYLGNLYLPLNVEPETALTKYSLKREEGAPVLLHLLGAGAWGGQDGKRGPEAGGPSAHRLASSSRHRY